MKMALEPLSPKILSAMYDSEFALRHTEIPKNPEDTPNILGWSGPARSGSTALLYLLAGHPDVDRVYYQPQKTLMRFGHPDFKLYKQDKLICMKEVFFSGQIPDETYDPIEFMLRAGVPAEKITWIIVLRDPVQAYSSWRRLRFGASPEVFAFWQAYSISLVSKYSGSKVKVLPFTYELLQGHEDQAIKRLLSKAGLSTESLSLNFSQENIQRKLVPGQAASDDYSEAYLNGITDPGKFIYKGSTYKLDSDDTRKVEDLCRKSYEAFSQLAKGQMGL